MSSLPDLDSEQGADVPGEGGYAILFDHMEEQLTGKEGQQVSKPQKALYLYL